MFQTKFNIHFSSLSCVLHNPAHLIILALTTPYLVKRTSHETLHCEVFSSLLPLLTSYVLSILKILGATKPDTTFSLVPVQYSLAVRVDIVTDKEKEK